MFSFNSAKPIVDEDKIDELLTRGTEDVFVKEHLKESLMSGKVLRVKLGIDPTSPSIHLGRAVVLRKLRAFQDLGHKVVLIIGDFTAKIGDPSDKLEKRPMLTDEDIQKNLKGYLNQIGKIIDVSKAEIRYNSEWLSKMDYIETARLLESFTVQQMTKRRNFQERLESGQDIFIVEFLYPALQGYDSVKVEADVELGGFDQLFNLKAGRTVQKKYGQKEQDVMTVAMLPGTDGRKMSSSWGNIISLLDSKDDMFGKVMAVNDELIITYFKLCTGISLTEVASLEEAMASGINPKDIKIKLAQEIVKIYHGETESISAKENFENTFSKGEIPDEITEVMVEKDSKKLSDILIEHNIVSSKSELRRLMGEGAASSMISKEKISDPDMLISKDDTYKIGKRRFIKVKIK